MLTGSLLALALALAAMAGWLFTSESGLRWAYRQATQQLPGELQVQQLEGSLGDCTLLHGVEFTHGDTRIGADRIELCLNPWALWSAEIDVRSLAIEAFTIDLPAPDESGPDETADKPGALQLPQIAMPLDLALRSMVVERARLTRGGQTVNLDRAALAATLRGDHLRIDRFELDATNPAGALAGIEDMALRLNGEIELAARYAHRIEATWQVRLANGEQLRNDTRIEGNVDATELTHRSDGPLQARLSLQLQKPLEQLQWQLAADIERFDSARLDARLPVASGRLELSAHGDAERAQASGRLDADTADIGSFGARFELSSLDPSRLGDGLRVDALEVAIYDGTLAAQGQVYWSPGLQWTARLTATGIDPAARFADWPGRIDAAMSSRGHLGDDGLDAYAEVSDASGRLRDYPFKLQGSLHWFDDGLEISAASLTSGRTRIDAQGRVGQVFDFDWSLQSGDLAELYPAASGQLSASGSLTGEHSAPVVEAKFTGSVLAVGEYSAAAVDGALAIDLLNWQRLDIRLDARELDLSGQRLQTLKIEGDQHRLDASLASSDFATKLGLRGAPVDGGWRGQLVDASVDSAEFADWRLQAPADLSFVDNTFALAPTCLQSTRRARICANGHNDPGATRFALELERMPLRLLRRWMPKDLAIAGDLDATADFVLRPGERLLGTLDAHLAGARADYPLGDGGVERFDFDTVKLSVALEPLQASAQARAQLGNGDWLEATLLLPGADILQLDQERQALQARLRVDARDWGVLDRLLPQVDNLRGRVQADLDIDGTLASPRLYGSATVEDGGLDIPGEQLGLRQVRANLRSDRGQPAQVEIKASSSGGKLSIRAKASHALSVDPLCLASSHEPQACSNLMQPGESWHIDLALARIPLALVRRWTAPALALDGVIDASAELEYMNDGRLFGTLDANLPAANATIAFDAGQGEQRERLAYRQVRLKLELEPRQARVDTSLVLQNGDRVDASALLPGADILDLDLERQVLQAKISAEARNWALLDAMLPQVDNLAGSLRLELELDGQLAAPRVQGSAILEQGSVDLLESRLRLERVNLRAQSAGDDSVRFEADAATAGGSIALSGTTLLDREAGWASSIELTGDNLDIATLIAQWVEQPIQVDGRMQARASLRYRAPDLLLGDIHLASAQGELTYPVPDRKPERWRYRKAALSIDLGEQGIETRAAVRMGRDNELEAKVDLPGAKLLALDSERQELRGRASLHFTEFDLVQQLIPEVDRLQGELTLDLDLAGKLASPLLLANAHMQQASFNIPRIGVQISDIELRGHSDAQSRFNFELTARSGEGDLTITGSSLLDPARGWPSRIRVTGNDFEVSRIPEAHVRVSPDLTISVEAREILVEGDILLPYAKLQPRDISTAARVSSDTVVIGREDPAQERWLVTTRVNVILGERVTFFGFGFEGKLGGRLRVDDAPGQLSVGTGEITITEGRYRAYGQRLDIENGRLLFTGSALDNPGLDVRAIRRINEIIVGLQLRGRVKQPQLELFSIPTMGQTDTLSYLILGRPMETASDSEGEMVARAALALGLAGGDTLARRIGDQFGIDEIRVESSDDGDQASLVVGRYLSPRLYVSYGVGLIESINSLNLRYELTERWKIEAESGEIHGADLLFSIER